MKLLLILLLLFASGSIVLARGAALEWYENSSSLLKSWSQAKSYCEDLIVDERDDWRLPSIEELELAYNTRDKFSNIEKDYYWSSTEHDSYPDYAWNILFYNGDINYYNKETENYILCVKEQIPQDEPKVEPTSQVQENNASSTHLYIKSY